MKFKYFNKEIQINVNKYIGLAVAFVFLDMLSKAPYINIFLTSWNVLIIIWVICHGMFVIKEWVNYVIAIVLLFGAVIITLFNRIQVAEDLGIIIYYLILISLVQYIARYIKKIIQKKSI